MVRTTENIPDISPSSRLLESLKENFPRVAANVEIRSFFETVQSRLLGQRSFVVTKHSACLYHSNETRVGLDADHRGLCKYDKVSDPNYIKMRDALSTTIDAIVRDCSDQKQATYAETIRSLRDFLGVQEPPEDDLDNNCESCLSDDTCSWFTSGNSFQAWRDNQGIDGHADTAVSSIFLIEAEPGAGKSVLASQVIKNLQALNRDCSYYFFDSQDRQKSTLRRLFRSLAFQMALTNTHLRQDLLELYQQSTISDNDSDKTIWRRLFTNCIFKCSLREQHYWVIDGLDECPQAASLLQLLFKVDSSINIKVFLTTRPEESTHRELLFHSNKLTRVCLSKFDSMPSMRAYVEARSKHLRLRKEEDRTDFVQKILDDADGSFLWVKLVLDDMTKANGPGQIENALKVIPKGMDHLYTNIITNLDHEISETEKPAVKAFLNWALCANPPLTVEEIEAALALERLERFADRMCERLRNLIIIDHSNKVRAVHGTARAFLQNPEIKSDFVISSTAAHTKIATLLVEYLWGRLRHIRNGDHLKYWQERKAGLDDYALLYFSHHIRRTLESDRGARGDDDNAPADDSDLCHKITRFFTDCANSWIACIAWTGSLDPLINTSQNLRYWLETRAKNNLINGSAEHTARMQQWTVDLVRLVSKFGRHMLESPGAIYTIIPPFLPQESALTVAWPQKRQISVTGLSNERWDDRLYSMSYQPATCTAVASGKYAFAVGLRNGTVHIYDSSTFQSLQTLQHGGTVRLLKFDASGSLLLSAGFRTVRMWLISEGVQMWEIAVREPRLAAEFLNDNRSLISISSQHELIKQVVATGATIETAERRQSPGSREEMLPLFRRELQYAEFSVPAAMLGTMQRERPIQLTHMEDRYGVGVVELGTSDEEEFNTPQRPVTAMTFCANIDVALLAIAYRDGTLSVFGYDLRLLADRDDNRGVTVLAGSPDGLTLAAATVEGVITLYDFERLTLLHILRTSSIEPIRSLVFTGDSHRIIDIRGRQASIWAPPALISRVKEDYDRRLESVLSPTISTSDWTDLNEGILEITALIPLTASEQFICGREDGSIAVYTARDSKQQTPLYRDQSNMWIGRLVWNQRHRVLAFISSASIVTALVLEPDWSVKTTLLRHTFLHPVEQLVFRETPDSLTMAVVTTKTVRLWLVEFPLTDRSAMSERRAQSRESDGLYLENAMNSDGTGQYLTLFGRSHVRYFSWETLEEIDFKSPISFSLTGHQSSSDAPRIHYEDISSIDRTTIVPGRSQVLIRSLFHRKTTIPTPPFSKSKPKSKVTPHRQHWILECTSQPAPLTLSRCIDIVPDHQNTAVQATLLPISPLIQHIIGFRLKGRQLIFLSTTLWICSYDLYPASNSSSLAGSGRRSGSGNAGSSSRLEPRPASTNPTHQNAIEYTRHIFIPDDWLSSTYTNSGTASSTQCSLLFVLGGVADELLIFVKKHEVAVIKEAFSQGEKVRFEIDGNMKK